MCSRSIRFQAEPCIRGEEPAIESYHILSTLASGLSDDLLSYAVRWGWALLFMFAVYVSI